MNVIDGNRDYLKVKDDFIRLYNNDNIPVKNIPKKLGITLQQYRLLRKECVEEGSIELRQHFRKKKEKQEVKNYTKANRGYKVIYEVTRKKEYYCCCNTEKEAQLIVERLRACNWDKKQLNKIRKEVKEMIQNAR